MKRLIFGAICCPIGIVWLLVDDQAINNNILIIAPTVLIVAGIILVISGGRVTPRKK
jgi:hypothetical protein